MPDQDQLETPLPQRLKSLRTERGWSLDALAATCGVSRSMLSQIERSEANPTLAVTMKIARAFGITIGELVEDEHARSRMYVIRQDDPQFHYRSDTDVSIRTLSPLNLEKDVEFYEMTLEPGAVLESAAHFAGTREFLTLTSGSVALCSGTERQELAPGDSANYRADVPHSIANVGEGSAVLFLVVIYR